MDFHVDGFDSAFDRAIAAGAVCERKVDAGTHPPAALCSDPFGNGFCLIGKMPAG